MNIFVGNLSFAATEADVKTLFDGFGSVVSVRIVMEKKGTKSRGFGFVQMPDDQQALAAIAALNGKDFMGRPLKVSPARPKPEVERDKGEGKRMRFETEVRGQEHRSKEGERKGAWYNPVFNKKRGRYKTGRRSQSFMKRRAASGIVEEARPKQEKLENPLRWRKNYAQPKPWQKSQGGHKPWKKTEGEPRSWRKVEGGSKPWKKKEGEFKPWKKSARSESKPWKETEGEPRSWRKVEGGPKLWKKSARSESKPWRRAEGESKPWKKKEGEPKLWKKSARSESKPRRESKKRPRPRQSRIESRRKPGGYTR